MSVKFTHNKIPCFYDDRDRYWHEKTSDLCPTQRAERNGIKVIENKINVIGNYSPSNHEASRVVDKEGNAPCVKENHGTVTGVTSEYRIRKLTPKECWRLMGFKDEDFEKAANAGISNTQLYKQAGNSIVVDVLYYIFKNLYSAMPYLFEDLKLGSYFTGIGAFECGLDRLYEDINAKQAIRG